MLEAYSSDYVWLIVLGFVIAFVLAFGIGANDVANSFGTSVGSKVLTITQACILATIFEIVGAILIGYKVSDTMRKGILDVSVYEDSEIELMLGCVSALASSAVWLLVATFFKLPISGTHSIVGASVGFSLVARGTRGMHWRTLGTIVASWFVSPVLSGAASVGIYLLIRTCVLRRPEPFEAGLACLPAFYAFAVVVNVFSVVHDGPKLLHMDNIPLWLSATVSLSVGFVCMVIVRVCVVPWQKRTIMAELRKQCAVNFNIGESTETSPEGSPRLGRSRSRSAERQLSIITENTENTEMLNMDKNGCNATAKVTNSGFIGNGSTHLQPPGGLLRPPKDHIVPVDSTTSLTLDINPTLTPNSSGVPLILERPSKGTTDGVPSSDSGAMCSGPDSALLEDENRYVSKLFSFLQLLTATFGSFAHGGNDVSNAIGPLIALWLVYTEGSVQQKSETPLYILLYGGVGIAVGLWLWGRRVIQTIGEDLTTITPSTGFTIEIGAAFTVLLASKIGLPISTTHCKVGSVVFVGYFSSSKKGVDWNLFRNIIYAWVVTVPVAALLSAACMFTLTRLVIR